MKKSTRPLVAALLPVTALSLHAADVVRGVTAAASGEWGGAITAAALVDNSGLRNANNPVFATTVDTLGLAPGTQWGYGRAFAPVDARYVRFQATNAVGGNPGIQEMIFYKAIIPEPSRASAGHPHSRSRPSHPPPFPNAPG